MNQVLIKKFKASQLDQVIKQGFEYFSMPKKLKKVKSVFIKPNLVSDVKQYIKQGVNTDIRIIKAVIKYLSQYPHLKIYLGKSEVGIKIKGWHGK